MRLTEAFRILEVAPGGLAPFSMTLACGFTPLHLATFLTAHLSEALPQRTVQLRTGLFGDLCGTLERVTAGDSAVAVALEWSDLDPRLGYRNSGGWSPAQHSEIVSTAAASLARVRQAMELIPDWIPVAICPPALPLPPVFHANPRQASTSQLALQSAVAGFLEEVTRRPSVIAVNSQRLDAISPPGSRHDLRSDLLAGFPYTVAHAAAAAEFLAHLVRPHLTAFKMRGLITDLDQTLWKGVAGEIGPDSVCWDVAGNGQIHGLFQVLLQALADQGVLMAAASKNEPAVVQQVFERRDLLLAPSSLFPVEAHWEPKSKSVGRILEVWNVGADAVVFVDDDPAELAEVEAAWPQIECLRFPADDPAAADRLFWTLRDRFGRAHLEQEDGLRSVSLRSSVAARSQPAHSLDSFLAQAQAKITADFNPQPSGTRVLELVNKTNQFNLNGVRFTPADWCASLAEPGAFVMAVSYEDRFGPLGKVAAIKGIHHAQALELDVWAMSCRAFCRRIEHRCLGILFDLFDAAEVRFHFAPTPRNLPFQQWLRLYMDAPPPGALLENTVGISRCRFEERTPSLDHQVDLRNAPELTARRGPAA